jgi:hypothetical protein
MSDFSKTISIGTSFPNPNDPNQNPDTVARFGLTGSDKAFIGVYNTGAEALNAFKVVFFGNRTAESVDGPSTATEWTSIGTAGIVQHGNPVDPTTLAAGAKMYFILDRLIPIHSLQILATVASGVGQLKIEFNRG